MAESLETIMARMDERMKAMDSKQDAHNDATAKALEPLAKGYSDLTIEVNNIKTNWFWTSTISAFVSTSIVLLASQWLHPSLAAPVPPKQDSTHSSLDTDVSCRESQLFRT